jgi:hypothetical protein
VLARQRSLSLLLCSARGLRGDERSLASSLRTHRYELDQRNSCGKNMLLPPNSPFGCRENGVY